MRAWKRSLALPQRAPFMRAVDAAKRSVGGGHAISALRRSVRVAREIGLAKRCLKPFMLLFTSFGCCLAVEKDDTDPDKEVKVEKGQVVLTVKHREKYADAGSCTLSYLLNNTSGKKYELVFSGFAFDPGVGVRLVAPSGKVMTAYKDMPGARFPAIHEEALFIEELVGRGYDMYLDLPYLYPIEEVGEYRCTLTARVYRLDAKGGFKAGEPGAPLDLVTPEIKFRIESVDTSVKSPLAKWVPSLNGPSVAPHVEDATHRHPKSGESARKSGVAKP